MKSQNPQQLDFRRMRQARTARTLYWKTKAGSGPVLAEKITRTPEDKKKPKKEKKPELEIVEDKPEIVEEFDAVLDDLYTYDEEIEE